MPVSITLDNLLGAVFIGIILSTVLYGVTCLQTYLYYTEYCKKDSLRLKVYVAFVVSVCTIDSLHVALLATTYYYYTVTNYGNYSALVQRWRRSIVGIVSFLVQLYVPLVSRHRWNN
ncbi:hypothetical protein FOMPIDRAFT_115943 [Fomitopsis schrenkii]|uniref:Uncharacterized protein n=1 Tax=Fomitopsis schrenkii TaxID=2126942 RepID=S8F377_FOMSC|nr:hypothetical protein FOMPIDRAFT_115943 [Fomitopsis schrenkii]